MTSPTTIVLGLDGVPHWLLRELADDGVMPNVARLLTQGTLRPLVAPVPDISSTSWASFLTGTDPGGHGIYGFIDIEPDSYRTYFPNLRHLRAAPLWRSVEAAGEQCLVLNVPGTYPAPAIDGVLVSGFVAPNFSRAVHPPALAPELLARSYQLDVEVGAVRDDPSGFVHRCVTALRARTDAFSWLLTGQQWRLAVCVITETDRLHHFLWADVRDSDSPLHGAVMDFYREVDAAIGRLLDAAPDATPMLVSDHGFGPAAHQFFLNSWLRQEGYLTLDVEADSLEAIDERTTAFALDPGRIYLNRRERFPRGFDLTPAGEAAVADEISNRLLALRIDDAGRVTEHGPGTPLLSRVHRRDDLYEGNHVASAPDLVAIPAHGVQIRGAWSHPTLTGWSPLTGTHTREDALFWCLGSAATGPVDMRDVAPTVLASIGIAPCSPMEGRDVRVVDTEPLRQQLQESP